MFSKDNCPIQTQVDTNKQMKYIQLIIFLLFLQITSSNDTITSLLQRIEDLEISLKSPKLPEENRKIVETELIEIKKLLHTNKELLTKLHKENSKSFALTACLVFACFLCYGVYVMIYGA